MQRGEERPFRTLLVYRPAAHYHLAESRFINESGFERRRRPLGGIRLLHVVHVVKTESARSTSVQRGDNAGLAVGGDSHRLLETCFAEHTHGQLAAFVHAAVFGGDGWLADPILQPLDGFIVAPFYFRANHLKIVGAVGPGGPCEGGCTGYRGGGSTLEEAASVAG